MMYPSLRFLVGGAVAVLAHDQAVLATFSSSSDHVVPFSTSLYPAASNLSDVDIAGGSAFSGLTTFAHLPYANCFVSDNKSSSGVQTSIPPYDIAFVGAPFDTAVSSRPGARFGPQGIRLGAERISAGWGWDVMTGTNPFRNWAKIIDCGDVPMTVFDNRYALKQLEKAHRLVSGRKAAYEPGETAATKGKTPRIIMLGGDHTVTLAALRAAHDRWGKVQVIHFDSHLDTWDPTALGGGISDYSSVNHGTFLHIAHEEGLIGNNSVHAGIRAPVARPKDDRRNDIRCGFDIVTARSIDRIGVNGIIEKLRARVGKDPVYVTVDIDVLDPAFAPATGTPEVGGWTTRELLSILDGLSGLLVIGADIVEVAPIYDTAGQTTALAAAQVAVTLMSLMVDRKA